MGDWMSVRTLANEMRIHDSVRQLHVTIAIANT